VRPAGHDRNRLTADHEHDQPLGQPWIAGDHRGGRAQQHVRAFNGWIRPMNASTTASGASDRLARAAARCAGPVG